MDHIPLFAELDMGLLLPLIIMFLADRWHDLISVFNQHSSKLGQNIRKKVTVRVIFAGAGLDYDILKWTITLNNFTFDTDIRSCDRSINTVQNWVKISEKQ